MENNEKKIVDGVPRRSRLDLNTPEELKIREAMLAIEKLPADSLLTDCVVLLGQAKDKLSDWIDKTSE